MAGPFTITAATNSLRLDEHRQAATSFTVFNNSGHVIRGRAQVVSSNPAAQNWFALVGEAEREYSIADTEQYDIQIAVPPGAPAGSYSFRLDVVGTKNPDEELTTGPTIQFEVPASVAPKKGFPIWIPFAALTALLLAGLIGLLIATAPWGEQGRIEAAIATAEVRQSAAQAVAVQTAIATLVPETVPDGSISTAKLAPGAVTTDKIADAAVDKSKLDANAVPSTEVWFLAPASRATLPGQPDANLLQWITVQDTTLPFTLARPADVFFNYAINVQPDVSTSVENVVNWHLLGTRLTVDGVPRGESGTHHQPYSGGDSNVNVTGSLIMSNMPAGDHTVEMQWVNNGEFSWSNDPSWMLASADGTGSSVGARTISVIAFYR